MKRPFWALLIIFVTVASFPPQVVYSDDHHIDFFIDLDDTLIEQVRPMYIHQNGMEVINLGVGDHSNPYALVKYTPEFLRFLKSIPGSRIIFFSAGGEPRNLNALSKINIGEGKSALDIAYKVLSGHHRLRVGRRQQKNLIAGGKDVKLDWSLLIDDDKKNVYSSQERNFIHVNFDGKSSREIKYLIQNRLIRAAGLIQKDLELSAHLNISLADANKLVQQKYTRPYSREIFQVGSEALGAVTPLFKCHEKMVLLR